MMKYSRQIMVCLLAPFLIMGCAKNAAPVGDSSSNAGASGDVVLPFRPVVVEDSETTDLHGIETQAKDLLAAKDFIELDALAKKYRDSKESYADGNWKLAGV
jgi:hypothetical protein